MAETRRKFDPDFRGGRGAAGAGDWQADRAGARDVDINEGTLGNWVNADNVGRARGQLDGLEPE